jgi:hypothetical protein
LFPCLDAFLFLGEGFAVDPFIKPVILVMFAPSGYASSNLRFTILRDGGMARASQSGKHVLLSSAVEIYYFSISLFNENSRRVTAWLYLFLPRFQLPRERLLLDNLCGFAAAICQQACKALKN